MRREPSPHKLHITPRGEVLMESRAKPSDDEVEEDMAVEFCNYDFPVGRLDTNNCTDSSKHSLILQEGMCIEAARMAGAYTFHDDFKLTSEWYDKHPKGCFKYNCGEARNRICYFFNGDGDWPTGPLKGEPICSRPRRLNGTKDSPAADGGCPAGYEVIDHNETCSEAAKCMGYCQGTQFSIGVHNASHHLLHPRGCFIDDVDGCVYYNGPSHMGVGTSVRGTPICNVSNVTAWPA